MKLEAGGAPAFRIKLVAIGLRSLAINFSVARDARNDALLALEVTVPRAVPAAHSFQEDDWSEPHTPMSFTERAASLF